MEALTLPREYARQMVEHALREVPNECCGVLAGADGTVGWVYPSINIDRSPVKYTIDPADLARIFQETVRGGQEVLAFYHSHTFSEAYPSITDVKLVPPSDLFDYLYVIVSLADRERPVIRAFRIVDNRVEQVPLEVTE